VVRLPTEASRTDEALNNIAALLNVDEADVMVGLARFDLLTLTGRRRSGGSACSPNPRIDVLTNSRDVRVGDRERIPYRTPTAHREGAATARTWLPSVSRGGR
jgi:hypothetical protein